MFLNEMQVIMAGIHKMHTCQNSKQKQFDLCVPVCLNLFWSQLVFEILDDLPYQ